MKQTSELDWLFGWMVADRHACLGNARVFVKKILKYVPVVGWAWNFRYLYIFQLDSNLSPVLSKKIAKITCKTTQEMLKKLLKTFYKKVLKSCCY